MKLLQRIVLRYYSLKLNTLHRISPAKCADATFSLFCTPYSKRKLTEVPPIFNEAEKLNFQFGEHKIHGFTWAPKASNGQKILLVHGFDSFSYRFARFVQPLVNEGFTVFAFDAPAHGLSGGKTINALLYKNLLLHILENFGPMDGIMAHSFGSIAAGLALEEMRDNLPKRLVIIAPATETTRSLNDFCYHLQLSEGVKQGLEQKILSIGGKPTSWYSVARIVEKLEIPVLWVHDKSDKITPYDDMKHLLIKELPHITFFITEGLGHSLYRDDNVAQVVLDYLKLIH